MINGILNNSVENLWQQNLLESNRLQQDNNLGRLADSPTRLKEELASNSDLVSIQAQSISEEDFQLVEQMSEEDVQNALDKISNSYPREVHNALDPQRVAFLTGI